MWNTYRGHSSHQKWNIIFGKDFANSQCQKHWSSFFYILFFQGSTKIQFTYSFSIAVVHALFANIIYFILKKNFCVALNTPFRVLCQIKHVLGNELSLIVIKAQKINANSFASLKVGKMVGRYFWKCFYDQGRI